MKRRLFVDMDGTLCRWKPAKEIEQIFKEGWFLHIPPHIPVINAVDALMKLTGAVEVFILSAVPNSEYAIAEKNAWLDAHLPGIDKDHRIFVDFRQPEKWRACPGPGGIRPTDILFDDYTLNLKDWEANGGKGLKLYNGVNGKNGTWKGNWVHLRSGEEAIFSALLDIIRKAGD